MSDTQKTLLELTLAKGKELEEKHRLEEVERSKHWRETEAARLAVVPNLIAALKTAREHITSGGRTPVLEVLVTIDAALQGAQKYP